ncbi:hypothetical protein D7D52_25625 [Nocardia yunnanensis]|uniref:Uncharacterized protein n=1 Tax=Nocardia yunnanensis TaxID=2382165 RepID=A0A386ZJ86_9NOCA|nr:hypothetical protein [Nocardia yunnanensis]AYF76635.1 hypothetical protein D7D52_25625 [Nocardia yunnanensis]
MAFAILAAVPGCGSRVDGSAHPAEIDVRTLDVGNYTTDPLETRFHYSPSLHDGLLLAEMRLDGQLVTGPEIDPRLKYGTGAKSFDTPADAAQILTATSEPVLAAAGMLFGVGTANADQPRPDYGEVPPGSTRTRTIVMQFPDAAAATRAAADLERADFQVAADANKPVSLPKYPDAHTHWRPEVPAMGSFLARGAYVVYATVAVKDPDAAQLTELVQKVYDAQTPLLDALPPLDREGILRQPWDPAGLLRQSLNPNGFGMPDFTSEFASGPRGFLHRIGDQDHWRRVLSDSKVDAFALSGSAYEGATMMFRAADPQTAHTLWSTILEPAFPGAVDAPPKVPGARCGEGQSDTLTDKHRYRCAITYRRFVATVDSDQLADAYQRAAAQYALLANSTW